MHLNWNKLILNYLLIVILFVAVWELCKAQSKRRQKQVTVPPLELLTPIDGCPYGFDNGRFGLQYGGKPEFCKHGNFPRHHIKQSPQNFGNFSDHPFTFSLQYERDEQIYFVNVSNKNEKRSRWIPINDILIVAKMVKLEEIPTTPPPKRAKGRRRQKRRGRINRAPVSITPFIGRFHPLQNQIGYCCGLNKYMNLIRHAAVPGNDPMYHVVFHWSPSSDIFGPGFIKFSANIFYNDSHWWKSVRSQGFRIPPHSGR